MKETTGVARAGIDVQRAQWEAHLVKNRFFYIVVI